MCSRGGNGSSFNSPAVKVEEKFEKFVNLKKKLNGVGGKAGKGMGVGAGIIVIIMLEWLM